MKVLTKYVSLSMAVLMLVMSIGITAHKMVCLVSGAVTLSFFKSDGCCPTESESAHAAKTACCDYSTDYFRMDIQTLVSNFDFRVDLATYVFTLPVFIFQHLSVNQVPVTYHSPPPLTGKSILTLVSVFRI